MDVYAHFQHTFMFKQHVKWILYPMTPLKGYQLSLKINFPMEKTIAILTFEVYYM